MRFEYSALRIREGKPDDERKVVRNDFNEFIRVRPLLLSRETEEE